ncbi:MMPL family transporter [Rhodococcus fascians]|nr:MMPL family transporter [Rhodococcus fascians]MBY3995210.1 MMPL family transporter [Rhodococcus fascians]MBY4000470.1 MMPL family transporter [Rhodococcus fascians]MBY4005498.1 MMPL family transporter [Rhodococcus fascians]MBY4016331.1 MMPL family transporter [Rhodococcus fascians]
MAWQLFRLGRWSFLHRKLVAGVWALLLLVGIVGAATLDTKTSDAFTLGGVESTEAFDLISDRTGESADGATARIVFEAPEGQKLTDPQNTAAVNDALGALRSDHVQAVADPFTTGTVSENGRAAYATVTYSVPAIELVEADRTALENVSAAGERAGLQMSVGGDAAAVEQHLPLGELIGIGVAIIVLAITFGSLLAAGMPLLTALIGVGIGVLGITVVSAFIDLSSTTSVLGTMLGLAVGIDYALFIMSRYQSEIRQGHSLENAAGRAVGTAGSAVVFAGLTVIIALAGLAICGIDFLTQMGLGGAFMVLIAVLVALTLLPAILGFAGQKVARGKMSAAVPDGSTSTGDVAAPRTNGRRWVEAVSARKWPALIAGLAVAVVVSIPIASMELAIPDEGTAPAGTSGRVAFDTIAENFGPGANGPLIVVIDTAGSADPTAAVNAAVQRLDGIRDDVVAIVPPAVESLDQQLAAVKFTTIQILPGSGPSDVATKNLVAEIRGSMADLPADTGARALVTGQTAVGVDIADSLTSVFPLYLAVVVTLAFLLLVLVFRSILVPLKAALGFLLSVGISLGATVAVFQWGWLSELIGVDTESPIVFLLPLLLTGILLGLAMDYEVFLVSRMREAHVHGTEARRAVIIGFQYSARVVVAAAVIMFGVFAGFALTDQLIIKTIGFALAIGILADAFLVRMLIVPAVMLIVGERMWWLPAWLDRLLPNLDIEGEGLADKVPSPTRREPALD